MNDFDSVALKLVSEFGGSGFYLKKTPGAYDPATGTASVSTTALAVKAVLLDLTLQSNGLSLKYNTEILAGDKEAYVIPPSKLGGPTINVDPVNDKFIMGGVEWSIVTFKEINPTGTDPIVYFLYLRK